ncbi:type 2 lantipeptide synthetase LanM [Nonomuraea mesophila]|uniref:Type 2 lantipeptide synthetase LanM n=1 Tax=Nonomuraea mesophila TaxID=2530382 RepID=A0A4R5F2H3_9ACTN|nr:type 2 lantipeptide synthetase LanM [Nonomuraea mesophila]
MPWELATTVTERRAAGAPTEVDAVQGDKRLAMWLELKVFDDASESADGRLAPLGVTVEQLAELLGETGQSLRSRGMPEPAWHHTFVTWWRTGTELAPAGQRIHDDLGLLEVARPLLEGALRQLHQAIVVRLASACVIDPVLTDVEGLVTSLQSTLPGGEVLEQVKRTMVTELNVARLEDRLIGDTPQDRFADFVRQLADPGAALAIWQEYPVLARMVVQRLSFWLEVTLELVNALIDDLRGLRERGLVQATATRLTEVRFGAGDTHRGGRSVAILTFDHGRLVFKPRPLVMDTAFDGLLAWLNNGGPKFPLRRTRMWDRGSHGWSEHVDASVHTDADGADRYAWRLGALTALLYAMHATDFHYENILAVGDDPVLVDLESLLHADKRSAMPSPEGGDESVAAVALLNSVTTIGVLPNRFLVRDGTELFDVDISGLGGRGGQKTPVALPTWDGDGTDAMQLVSRHMDMEPKQNLPTDEHGHEWDLFDRADQFAEGFTDCYRALMAGREDLLAADGLLSAFGNARSRLILRPTQVYGRVLMECSHPDFLRDGLDLDRSLARLLGGHQYIDCHEEIIRSELAEMHRGDIPIFGVDVTSGVIHGGWQDARMGVQERAPLDTVQDRVRELCEEDRGTQEWIIRSTITASRAVASDKQWPNWARERDETGVAAEEATAEALRLAHRLDELAVRDGGRVGWIGLGMLEERFWRLTPAESDMYTGLAGIGLALDAVAAITGDERSYELAGLVFDQLARQARWLTDEAARDPRKRAETAVSIGVFEKVGGGIYSLAHAAAHRRCSDLAAAAESLLSVMDLLVDEDDFLDVVSGAAGAIFALLALHRISPDSGALPLAERCARQLIDGHVEMPVGWGWKTRLNPDVALTGFSHGASGIAVALARLNEISPRDEYVHAVRQALRYEDSIYDPHAGAWPDLRPDEVSNTAFMSTWCHGGPGIALARDELLRLGTVPDLAEQLDLDRRRGVQSILSTGLDQPVVSGIGNHCLCHGDVGNLLIAQRCHRPGDDPEVAGLLPKVWRTLINEGRTNRWLCGVPDGIETPDLMTGLAGIAWGLAHLARPETVPNVLTLAAPDTAPAGA